MNARPLVVVLALACSAPRPAPDRTFDPAPWLEDLTQLEEGLGQHYGNLEWNVRHRGLDPGALDRTTREALARAGSEGEALEVMVRFIAAFRDPHLAWTASAPSTRYDVRLTSDGATVRVRTAGPGACGAKPGDVVDTIQGRPALEQLQARLPLSTLPNPALARDDALRTFTSSVFAPKEALHLHLQLAPPRDCVLTPLAALPERPPGISMLSAETPGAKACEVMGIPGTSPPADPLGFHPERHPEFTPAPGSWRGAGTVRLPSGKTLGWLRVPLFSEESYPAICAEAWETFRAHLTAPCGEQCQEGFRGDVLTPRLVSAIAERLEAFRTARVSGVVVDITDNGGGTDWTVDVAHFLSSGELSCPAVGRVREPAAAAPDPERLHQLQACLAGPLDAGARRAVVDQLDWDQAVRADAAQPCDWRPVFRAGGATPACSMLGRSRRGPCQPSLAPPGGRCAAFGASPGHGLVTVPVFVLMNRRTASAAELFAAILRDGGAATLVGERTLGAGCGYIDGGNEVRLKRAGLVVRMPNCSRYRLDGSNELEGIAPDVELPWTGEDLARFDSYSEKALAHAGELFVRP